LEEEYGMIKQDQIIFTYLHLAANRKLTSLLIERQSINIAYETIQCADGSLPLLMPMSEVAGRMSIQQGANYLQTDQGGSGVLLGGVTGVEPATVVILGAGVVGVNAAEMACGLGAKVYLLDKNIQRLRHLSPLMPKNCFLITYQQASFRHLIQQADLLVGAVLVAGNKAPQLVTREMLTSMKKGSVLVDVCIDQGGCFETSKATTHANPTYLVEGIVHYCVANMPGAVPKTSTVALTNATLPYILEIANKGWETAFKENAELALGANVVRGEITHQGVAEAFKTT
jgi:alanine dehydrogenase